MEVAGLQGAFQDYVLGAQREYQAMATLIQDGYGLSVQGRLAIYYDAYRLRLAEALAEAFGHTHAYVGDDAFAELCSAYINEHPSTYRNLRWFGDAFPALVAQRLPEHPVVAELARFEWALGLAFDAADAPVLTAAQMQGLDAVDWDGIGFDFHPSLQLLELRWNATAIWQALEREDAPSEATEAARTWLVWRKELQPHFRSLDAFEAQALRGLVQRKTFAEVCTELTVSPDRKDEAADANVARLAAWLSGWLAEGILTAIRR